MYEPVLVGWAARFGPDHPNTIEARHRLARLLWSKKDFVRAIALLEESLEQKKAQLGPEAPDPLGSQVTLGEVYYDAGRCDVGVRLIEDVRLKGREDPLRRGSAALC